MIEPINGNISFLSAAVAARSREVGVHGRAVVLLIAALDLQAVAEKSVATGGVDQLRRFPDLRAPVIVLRVHADAFVIKKFDVQGAASFDDVRALGGRAPHQDFIELRPSDLVCHGQRFVPGVRKLEFLATPVPVRYEFRAPFLHADGADLVGHPKTLQERQIRRQQRLADVKPGMARLFQEDHPIALFRQQDGGGRAGGPAPDD